MNFFGPLVEAEGADIKVTGKRETMEELRAETKEGEENVGDANAVTADGEGEENGDENDKEGKADEDEETKKLPKYSPGIPVGKEKIISTRNAPQGARKLFNKNVI